MEHKRIILFFDVDCFEWQANWNRRNYRDGLIGKNYPGVVINEDNVILSVNYDARAFGITREDSLRQAKRKCNELIPIVAPTIKGIYHSDYLLWETDRIINVCRAYKNTSDVTKTLVIEMTSRDEFYIDVTQLVKDLMAQCFPYLSIVNLAKKIKPDFCNPVTIMQGVNGSISGENLKKRILTTCYSNPERFYYEKCLVVGAVIGQNLMVDIKDKTGYAVSVGVGHNKLTAKQACKINKPDGITILPDAGIDHICEVTPFQDIPGYQGSRGYQIREEYQRLTRCRLETLEDVQYARFHALVKVFCKIGVADAVSEASKLKDVGHLLCDEEVQEKYYTGTVNQSVSFKNRHTVRNWHGFDKKLATLCRLYRDKLRYRKSFQKRQPTLTTIKAVVCPGVRGCNRGENNSLEHHDIPPYKTLRNFLQHYINTNGIHFLDLEQITFTGSRFENV